MTIRIRRAEEGEGGGMEMVELPEYDRNTPEGVTGLHIVRSKGIIPRTRQPGASKYNIAELNVGDAYTSDQVKDIRNVGVAARTYARKIKESGGIPPVFATRKQRDGERVLHFLIRES